MWRGVAGQGRLRWASALHEFSSLLVCAPVGRVDVGLSADGSESRREEEEEEDEEEGKAEMKKS